MPWVRFTKDFDWRKAPRVVTAYKAGMVLLVSQAARDAATAAGAALDTPRPENAPAVTATPPRAVPGRTPTPPRVRRRKNVSG